MKNIILQHYTGPLGELEKLSLENIRKYAEFCGAEHQLIRGNIFHARLSAPCQKVYMLDKHWDSYDNVVMMDIDMFTRKGLQENIFDVKGMGRHFGIQTHLVQKLAAKFPHLGNVKYPYWGGSIYKWDRATRQNLRQHLREDEIVQFHGNYEDEGIMHRLAVLAKMPITDETYFEDDSWNKSSYEPDVDTGKIIHIRPKAWIGGPRRPKIENYRELVERGII